MSESASNKAIGAKTGVKKIKRQPKPTTKLFQWLYDYDFLYAPILSALVILVVALVKITSFVNLSLGIGIADDTSVFQSSLVASVGVCGPIFLELFQDLSFVIVGRLKKTRALHVGKMRYFIGRIILLAALLIPSCFLLLQVQLGSPYADREVLFICVTFVRRVAIMCAVLFCMTPLQGEGTFTQLKTFGIMLFYSAAQLCEFFNINAGNTIGNVVLNAFSIIFLIISYAWICWLVILWALKKRLKLMAMFRGILFRAAVNESESTKDVKAPKTSAKVIPEEFYEFGILVLSFLACITSHVVDGQHSWNGSTQWGVVTSVIKAGYMYLAILFTSFMSALLGRHARIAVIIEKENSLEAKKSFIRYISHEIRTPLNTVCLGLDVLGDDLKKSTNPIDIERCETISDISSSCQIALSILNDLLNMDKVESGTLVLEKKLESVLPFLGDAMTAFKLQAEKQQVALILDTDCRGPPERAMSLALPGVETIRRALALDSARTNATRSSLAGALPRIASNVSELQVMSVQGSESHEPVELYNLTSNRSSFDNANYFDTTVIGEQGLGSTPPLEVNAATLAAATAAAAVLTMPDRLGRGIGPDDCANIDVHKFGQVLRNLLSNALKFTKSDGVVTMRVRSVDAITLDELLDTEEFLLFGKMPVWEMLHLAVSNHQATTSSAKDVDPAGETADLVMDMASSSLAGGAPSSEAYTVGSAMAARIRETRKSFSRGNRHSSSRDSMSQEEGDSSHSNKPPSSNRFDDSGHSGHSKSRGGGGGGGGGGGSVMSSSRGQLFQSARDGSAKRDSSPTGSNQPSRENSARLTASRRGSKTDSGQIGVPPLRVSTKRGGDSPLMGGSKEGSREGSRNTSKTATPRGTDLRSSLDFTVTEESTRMIVIEVIDSGVGLTADILPRIFNEVLQVNPGELQQGGGSGLGLMLTKGIVDQHGGKISVYSAGPNEGCTFTILLPMFKSGNQQIEEKNREEANMFSRRVFINKFLEKNVSGRPKQNDNPSDLALLNSPLNSPLKFKPPTKLEVPTHAQTKVLPGYIRRNGAFNQLGAYILRIAEVDDESESVDHNALIGGLSISGRGENLSMFDGGEEGSGSWVWRPGTGTKSGTPPGTAGGGGVSSSAPNLPTHDEMEGADGGHDSEKGELGEMPVMHRPRRYSTVMSSSTTQLERMKAVSNLYILVVDDSTLNRKMLVKLLEGRGHACDEARNGKDATTKVELQLIELRRRIESQKAKAARDIMLKSNESLTVAGGSGSLEYDQSNHSIMSRNSFGDGNISRNSFGDGNISRRNSLDGKDGEIRKSSLRLPPLEHRVLSPAKSVSSSSRMQQPVDRMYDVVMLDHMMPVMDGPTAAAEIRAMGFSGLIVGVTGNVLAADTKYFKSRGANHVLGKPLNMDVFNKAIRDYANASMA